MSDWQMMDTAPRDGTLVAVLFDEGEMIIASYDGKGWWDEQSNTTKSWDDHYARFWLPLPPAPSRQKDDA